MDINDYIDTSRFSKGQALLDLTYQNIYSEMCTQESNVPLLKTCYTSERTCEFVAFGDQEYIIYDQYIGQTLNMFNRIFYNSTDKFDSIVYAYKCFAEIFHYMGNIKMAALCAHAYILNRGEAKSFKKDVDINKRIRTTLLQEKFILLHEIYHWKFSRLSPRKRKRLVTKKRKAILFNLIFENEVPAKEAARTILDDAMKALPENELSKIKVSEQQIDMLAKELEENRQRDLDLQIKTVSKRDDLIEETLCDEYALKQLVKSEKDISFSEIFYITFIGIESLQTMTYMRNYVMNMDDNMSLLVMDSAIRKMAFRKCTARKMVKGIKFQELHEKTTEINMRFSEIIRDPIMFVATYNLKQLLELEIGEDEDVNLDELIYNI